MCFPSMDIVIPICASERVRVSVTKDRPPGPFGHLDVQPADKSAYLVA